MTINYNLEKFLVRIESLPESTILRVMGEAYIDTPGYWSQESDFYHDIFEFMQQNMGSREFERLIEWCEKNPKKVAKLMQ